MARYHEMENLLKQYKGIEGASESIKYELYGFSEGVDDNDVDDFISAMTLKGKPFDYVAVDNGGYIGDKTGNIAMNYRKQLEKENEQLIKDLESELFILQLVLDKLNIGLRRLPSIQQQILWRFYVENKTWIEVLDLLDDYISKDQAQRQRRDAIERLQVMCRITISQYQEVAKLLN